MNVQGSGEQLVRSEAAVALEGGADLAVLEREALALVADLADGGVPIVEWKPALRPEQYRQIYEEKYAKRRGFTASPPPPPTPPVPAERLRVEAVTKFQEKYRPPVSNSPRVDKLRRKVVDEAIPKVETPYEPVNKIVDPDAFDPPSDADEGMLSPRSDPGLTAGTPGDSGTGAADFHSDMATSLSNFGDFMNRTGGSWSFQVAGNPGEEPHPAAENTAAAVFAAEAEDLEDGGDNADLSDVAKSDAEADGAEEEEEDDLFARAAASLANDGT